MSRKQYEGGYFKAPDFIFSLDLPPYAIVVLLYFCRRADKHGLCFPSVKKIARDTGIKSETSVRKSIRQLVSYDLVRVVKRGKEGVSNRYQLTERVLSKVRNGDNEDEHDTPPYYDPATPMTKLSYRQEMSTPPSANDGIPHHQMTPKEDTVKEYTVKEHTAVESEQTAFSQGSLKDKFSTKGEEVKELSNPAREVVDTQYDSRDRRVPYCAPTHPPENNTPNPHNELARKAIDRLRRYASGEDDSADLTDIYREFDELKGTIRKQ